MKLGILGGTFDPPHLGHLELARAAQAHLNLDVVMFVPANKNPLKSKKSATPARHRLKMVAAMLEDEPKMLVSDVEISRGGPSYMVETLADLQHAMPGDYWLILGSDSLNQIHEWYQVDQLLRTTRLAVATRPGSEFESKIDRLSSMVSRQLDVIPMEPKDISATEIRAELAKGQVPDGILHPRVQSYIKEHGLYQGNDANLRR